MGAAGSVNAFTIVLLSVIPLCIILSCCVYIFNRKKQRKRQNIQFNNDHYAPDTSAPVFIVEMPYTQSPRQVHKMSLPTHDTAENPVIVDNPWPTNHMN